jgi:Flp pilus assembly protein TadD
MLVDKHREAEAIAVLRDHLVKHPEAVAERRMLIRVLALTGDLGAAEREATTLGEHLGPAAPTPWIEMGHAFELNHRYEDALSMFDRAAEVAPKDPAGPREGGLRAAAWGEAELAEPRLAEALRRDPRDAKVWHVLGLVRLKLEDFDGAREAYGKGLVADPTALENRVGLATVALAVGDAKAALEQYDVLAQARPKVGDVQLGRAWALARLGRFDEAEAALDQAEKLGGSRRAIRAQRQALGKLKAHAEGVDNR